MGAVLDAHELTKRYAGTTVLDAVSLVVEPGTIHGVLGPNGSGKTTCLHIVTGLVKPDEGSVLIGSTDVALRAARRLFGFAPDDLPLPDALTGREYLRFHDALRGRDDEMRATELAEALVLADDLDRPLGDYSHGMRRKLQVIGAVMHDPLLLVLDEPFRGLDPEAAATLRAILVAFAGSGRSVLVATHDLLRAERDCDRVTVLSAGRVVAAGAPADLIAASDAGDTLDDVFMAATGRAGEAERRRAWIATTFPAARERPDFGTEFP
jgi:ABC-2 type transport system ATP-binding protein